ncbi:MAG TPA: Ig-like domain-containing protein, partial [Coriobacteriia bacterium]|nr:Ig-like domain-containing protein [Coriobacteriia bacterium]
DGALVTSYVPESADTTLAPVTVLQNLSNGAHTMSVTVSNASGGTAVASTGFVVDGQLRPSSTVPYATEVGESGAQSRWTAWQNNPILSFNTELTTVEGATELLYLVDRSPMTTIDPTTPNLYYSSSNVTANSSLYEGTIDLLGVYLSNPGTFAGSLQLPGATEDLEGLWYTHALVRNASSEAGPLSHVVYGVDMTEPSIVTGLAAYPDNNSATPVSGWLEQTRAVLRWDGAQYDSLSGVHHYNVYIDGAPAGDELSAVPYEHGRGRMSLTIENLAPGPHAIQVSAVDQAGNEGPLSSPTTVRIKSTPTISIGSPVADGVTIGTPVTLRARVKDPSGVTSVVFTVEGMPSQTFTPGPNDATDMSCSMLSPLLSGNYTLTVTAHSASGTSKTVQRFFTVDSSLPQETDPGDPGDPGDDEGEPPVVTPAYQWFNTRFPSFNAMPSDEPTAATELLYLVDRTPNSPIDADNPNAYYSSFRVEEGTTHVNGVVDQYGVYLSDPSSFDGAIQLPGRVTQPMEGTWYLHALFRNSLGDAGPTAHVAYGVDLTPPAAVTDVNVYSSNTDTTPLTGWLDQSRVVIRWDGSERDLLSGTDHYRVYVDGQSLSEATDAIAFQSGRATMSVTVEDLAPGAHKIQVTAVDKAGNESAMSGSAYARLDAGIPTVKVTSPSKAGAKLNLASTLAAYATDEVSVESVTFRVDGVTVGTVRPDGTQMNVDAKVKPDWTRFSSGSHTLSVSVADQVGHVVSASRSFTLDRTAPTLSSVTGGYNPFYPRKRDGYRDYYYTHFKSSEAGTAKLVIKDSKGNTWRTIYKAVPSGSSTVRWDGKSNDGSMKEGTFRWYLKVKDAAGNYSTTKSGSTSLRYYVVVKTGTNTVKLVAH